MLKVKAYQSKLGDELIQQLALHYIEYPEMCESEDSLIGDNMTIGKQRANSYSVIILLINYGVAYYYLLTKV